MDKLKWETKRRLDGIRRWCGGDEEAHQAQAGWFEL